MELNSNSSISFGIAFTLLFFIGIMLTVLRPSFAQSAQKLGRASIQPSLVILEKGEKIQFRISQMPMLYQSAKRIENVVWSVNGIVGGSREYGVIDKMGVYQAPKKTPKPHEIHIIGKVEGVQNKTLFATVLMDADKPFYKHKSSYRKLLSEEKNMKDPHGVVLDKNGNLVIADVGFNRVTRFSPDGQYLGDLGTGPGLGDGFFSKVRVSLLDKDGDIYISDQKDYGDRIQVFDHDGKLKLSFGPKGTGPGRLLRPHGMDFDAKGNLFVVDVDNFRVVKFAHEGEYLDSWGQDGARMQDFNAPHGLAVDANSDVFVSGYYGVVQKFDCKGNFLKIIEFPDPPDGSVYIHTIVDDKWGNIYAMVRGMRGEGGRVEISHDKVFSIEKYNNYGEFITGVTLDIAGHAENWVAIDDEGNLYAIYRGTNTVGFEVYTIE